MKYKAIIFDMDGTLIDNLEHWKQADTLFLSKFQIEHTQEYVNLVNGRSLEESVDILRDKYNLTQPVEEILAEKLRLTDHIYDIAEPMPGADILLKNLKEINFKTAIASGSSTDRIEKIVNRLGWNNYFNALISVDNVGKKGKPDPAIYSYAANTLSLAPEDCLVLEDSQNGLLSAKRAGMKCAVVSKDRIEDFTLADAIFNSLADVELYQFLGL